MGYGVSATAVVAPVYISCEDFSFPQIITDLLVELLRWLCWRKGLTDTERGLSGPSARYWQRCRSAGTTSWIGLRSLEDCDPEAAFACSPRRRLLNLSTEFRSVASAALLSRDLAEIALIG